MDGLRQAQSELVQQVKKQEEKIKELQEEVKESYAAKM